MNIEFLITNRTTPATLIPEIIKEWRTYYEVKAFMEYYTQEHKVNSKVHRPMREVIKPAADGSKDSEGNPNVERSMEDVNRLSIPMQKLIVSRKTAFTTGGGITFRCKPEGEKQKALFDIFQTSWRKNKLDYRNSDLFRKLISETEVAEIWYTKKNEETKELQLKCNIYSPSDGYELIPVFDAHRDLIAFGLKYTDELTNIEHLHLYDKEYITKYSKEAGNGWEIVEEPQLHYYGKIPVVYYSINQSVWQDVQQIIERYETLISNHADTNDANAFPLLFAKGGIFNMPNRGERGRVIENEDAQADLKYVTWDNAPNSLKLEFENLTNLIYTMTQTPNISFEQMKGLGDISGAAWDRIMVDAHLSAKDFHDGVYGEGIQRRINLMLYMLSAINTGYESEKDMEITPKFGLFSIDSQSDSVEIMMKANGNKPVIDWKASIQGAGLTDDVEATYEELSGNQE